MIGFPSRVTRNGLGPVYEDSARVMNPKRNLAARIFNILLRQVVGMNGLSPRGYAWCDVAGNAVTVRRRWLAWDPNSSLPLGELVFERTSAGVYTWTFANASYPDLDGEATELALEGVLPVYQGTGNFNIVGAVNANGASGTINAFNAAGAAADVSRFLVWFV